MQPDGVEQLLGRLLALGPGVLEGRDLDVVAVLAVTFGIGCRQKNCASI